MRWRITIEAWPHSTGDGAENDQKSVGERENYFYVDAYDFDEVFRMAKCFSEGMCRNPAVWKAPITAINKYERNK